MTPSNGHKRSRAGTFLLLYVLSLAGVSRVIGEMESTEEKLGALLIPMALLGAGCWYAFKEGGRMARICAALLAVLAVGSFGYGFVKGFGKAQGAREANAELDQLRAGLVADSSDPELGPDAARRHAERTQAAARRMQSSGHAETAALGRAMEAITDLTQAYDKRLLAAMDAIGSERFLDLRGMLDDDDFPWQRTTVQEYAAAAQAAADFHRTFPEAAREQLERVDLSPDAVQQVLVGVRRVAPYNGRVLQAHLRTASAYAAVIDFVEAHREGAEVLDDASLEFDDEQTESDYYALVDEATAAENQLNAAVDGLMEVVAKR